MVWFLFHCFQELLCKNLKEILKRLPNELNYIRVQIDFLGMVKLKLASVKELSRLTHLFFNMAASLITHTNINKIHF